MAAASTRKVPIFDIDKPNPSLTGADLTYAVNLVTTVCVLAGRPNYLAELRASARQGGLIKAVANHDTSALFDWFVDSASFQGISDAVAASYMRQHGSAQWHDLESALAAGPSCEKLSNYWRFYDCNFRKGQLCCSEPSHFDACPLPKLPLRNGSLNQLAYSFFLFVRDIAGGDLVGWIDTELAAASAGTGADRKTARADALIRPLREVHGVSDKVLNMTLANLLVGAGAGKSLWLETGADLIAIDTLVHNFLARTGILERARSEHPYGPQCYGPDGCAALVRQISGSIDCRQFSSSFPEDFPRYVQSSIWRYCSGEGLGICNGNQIDDRRPCNNIKCRLHSTCDKNPLQYR